MHTKHNFTLNVTKKLYCDLDSYEGISASGVFLAEASAELEPVKIHFNRTEKCCNLHRTYLMENRLLLQLY